MRIFHCALCLLLFLMIMFGHVLADEIRLSIGESKTLLFPGLKRVENTNKKLMRVRIIPDKNEISLTALSKGNGTLLIEDELGDHTFEVIVYSKLALDLEREIKELTANVEGIEVRNVGHQIVLSGKILTPQDYEIIKMIEKRYENVITMATPLPSAKVIQMEKMIQVELKMIELNKNRLRSIGLQFPDSINTHFSLNLHRQNDSVTTTLQAATQFDLIFRALEKKGLAKILANPKLICKNGGEAKFLAGGEIPIRLSHEKSLSVEWKPYGISLHIFPTADSQNHISVTLNVEISTLNDAQSIDGMPGMLTRRLETSLNVKEGETIILSGLLHQENSEDIHRVPALSSIPILGILFQSKQFQNRNTELMIFVTPTLRKEEP